MHDVIRKELYVALHGQSARFRLVKYAILVPLLGGIYWWKGGAFFLKTLGILLILALAMHFFFRWKSKGWMEDYGPYKSLFR